VLLAFVTCFQLGTGISEAVADVLLLCPGGYSLCTWSEQGGWSEPLLDERAIESIADYKVLPDGRMLLSYFIHASSGISFVLDSNRNIVLSIVAGSLDQDFGLLADGSIIVCAGEYCSIQLPLDASLEESSTSARWRRYSFPRNCRFPRTFGDGRAVCYSSSDSAIWLEDLQTQTFHAVPIELTIPWISDLVAAGDQVAVLSAGEVVVVDSDGKTVYSTAPTPEEEIERLHSAGDLVLLEYYREDGETELRALGRDHLPVTIWSGSGRRTLQSLHDLGSSEVLLELGLRSGDRELVVLDLAVNAHETVWVDERLWPPEPVE
jgi:hypothetical protein